MNTPDSILRIRRLAKIDAACDMLEYTTALLPGMYLPGPPRSIGEIIPSVISKMIDRDLQQMQRKGLNMAA